MGFIFLKPVFALENTVNKFAFKLRQDVSQELSRHLGSVTRLQDKENNLVIDCEKKICSVEYRKNIESTHVRLIEGYGGSLIFIFSAKDDIKNMCKGKNFKSKFYSSKLSEVTEKIYSQPVVEIKIENKTCTVILTPQVSN